MQVTFPQGDKVRLEVLSARTKQIPQYHIRQAVKEYLERHFPNAEVPGEGFSSNR